MSIEAESIPIETTDGVASDALVFAPVDPFAALVFHSGLGVPSRYYEPFGRALAEAGCAVVLVESRGTGSSRIRARRGVDFGYRELVERELPAAIAATQARLPGLSLLVGGHSLGAQVAVLASASLPESVVGLVLVAGGTPWYGGYDPLVRMQVRLAALVFPAVSRALGWFPGRVLGFGGREAKTLMLEWSDSAATGRYVLRGPGPDWEAEAADQTRPVLAITIDGDGMAPPSAMASLTRKLPLARVETHHLAIADGKGRAHFRWARRPEPVVASIAVWARRIVAGGAGRAPRGPGGG